MKALLVAVGAFLALATPHSGQCLSAKLSPGSAGDAYGTAVAIQGQEAVLGSPEADSVSLDSGEAKVYLIDESSSTLVTTLLPSNLAFGDRFGWSVDIDGDTILVGAPFNGPGSAHVFERNGSTWTETQELVASDGAGGDSFGSAVSLHGDRAIIGAPRKNLFGVGNHGLVYVFERVGGSWAQVATMKPDLPLSSSFGASFGASLDLHQDTAIVGSPSYPLGGAAFGAAFLFQLEGGSWVQKVQMGPFASGAGAFMGTSVAISEAHAVIGSPRDSYYSPSLGAVHLWTKQGGSWLWTNVLVPQDAVSNGQFGDALALVGGKLFVGAPLQPDGGIQGGAVYCFKKGFGFSWEETSKLTATDATVGDGLGKSVAASAELLIAGASNDGDAGPGSGSVYSWALSGALCPPLYAAPPFASASSGGFQVFNLNAGSSQAGNLYFLLGSASGTSPGVTDGSITLPLNPDGYMLFTLQHPNTLIEASLGFLDANGAAQAELGLLAGFDPALAGVQLSHAYVVIDFPGLGHTLAASNATTLALQP